MPPPDVISEHRSGPPGRLVVSPARFARFVSAALDTLPGPLGRLLDNVAVVTADRNPDEPGLLGLYEGVPLTERETYGAGGAVPDLITVYRLAHLDICSDETDLAAEVRVTVLHELAHHFGIDDDRLDELGWS